MRAPGEKKNVIWNQPLVAMGILGIKSAKHSQNKCPTLVEFNQFSST